MRKWKCKFIVQKLHVYDISNNDRQSQIYGVCKKTKI